MELINGVKTKALRLVPDDRGWLMEILRSDDVDIFEKFGQVYITICYPGVIKAWHYHKVQSDNMAVVQGNGKIVLYDPRDDSPTKGMVNEFFPGERNPLLIKIPPLVYHGFTTAGREPTAIVNCPTELYDRGSPDEERLPFDSPDVPYDWKIKSR